MMGGQKWLLAALVTVVCIYDPACGEEGCNGFRHLDNGQTFFRYGGLLVVFRCHPGYKLHGFATSSCVSGHWSREPPVCVGSGCFSPGSLIHGTSSINEDGSWAEFSCNSGFHLHGPSMLYCKGHTWNGTKPVCKESDIMSSILSINVNKSNTHQNLQASAAPKRQQHSHFDTSSKEADLKFGLVSLMPSNIFNIEKNNGTNSKAQLQKHTHFSSSKVIDGVHTSQGSGRYASQVTASLGEAGRLDRVTQMLTSKYHLSAAVSSTMSLVSRTESLTSSPPSFSAAQTPDVTAFTNTAVVQSSQNHYTNFASPMLGFQKLVTSQELLILPVDEIAENKHQQAETGFQSALLSHPLLADQMKPTERSTILTATSTSTSSPAVSTSSIPSTSNFNMTTQPLNNTTDPPNILTTSDLRTLWAAYQNLTELLSSSRRPVCPYPPVPPHGTFYFRNVEKPGPREFRHFIQYACYPGYTLAHGDIHSYCQRGGTWSGITPVCLELTPCSVNNGGCSQLCFQTQNNNQSYNQMQIRTQCHCKPGFVLLDDGQTCRDLDECEEGWHQCPQSCINTLGSFKCGCDVGYQPAPDQTACTDVDECVLPAALTGCMFGCVNTLGSFHCRCPGGYSQNTPDGHCQDIDECAVNEGLGPCMQQCHNSPGSYRCSCTYGHILAGDGHSCFSECPPGYRKQTTTSPENSFNQTLKDKCVDINECLNDVCEWQCINLPGSHRCICPRGYTLQRDGLHCKDINECKRKNGGCSHLCVNQRGGYKCACPTSHRLSSYSWKKCLPRTTEDTLG